MYRIAMHFTTFQTLTITERLDILRSGTYKTIETVKTKISFRLLLVDSISKLERKQQQKTLTLKQKYIKETVTGGRKQFGIH